MTTNGKSSHHGGKTGARPRPPLAPKRRKGQNAEEAQLRARVDLARALGDPAEERSAAKRLAELLAARGAELDFAVELAFKALQTEDDPALRHALAGWLERLGEPGLAASELRKLASATSGADASAILTRIGVLHARAGDAIGAQEALSEAAEQDEKDALPLELLGAVAAWSVAARGSNGGFPQMEGSPTPRMGAQAYVQAAKRRAAANDAEGEMENLLRAFELDPTSSIAAASLVSAYKARSKPEAADYVLRAHAAVVTTSQAAEIHEQRRTQAMEAGYTSRALAAALDAQLDGVLEGEGADAFDDLLAKLGAYEPLAVRLELRAERASGKEAAKRWAELGRLLAGPLAAAERAVEAYARAVAADASNTESLHALKSLAMKTGDAGWLIEALIRAVRVRASDEQATLNGATLEGLRDAAGRDETMARLAAAHALAGAAEDRNDPLLAAWAYRAMTQIDPSDERARATASRLEGAVRRHEEELGLARRALETSAAEGRSVALLEIVRLARSLPDESPALASALVELAEASLVPRSSLDAQWVPSLTAEADDENLFQEACRVAERVGDFTGLAKIARARLDARGPNVKVRNVLVAALRRKGDLGGASDACKAFAEESATRWTCSVAWITAAAANEPETRGRALAAIAPATGGETGAAIAAVAAEILADIDGDAARRAAQTATRSEDFQARVFVVLAKLVAVTDGRLAQSAVEHAIEAAGPSAIWCERLAEILSLLGDARGAVGWARRRVALRPGEPAAASALVDRAVKAGDAGALADALAWLAPQPQPAREMADRIAPALEALGMLDPARALQIGKRALDVLGPRNPALRRVVQKVADAGLRIALAERWIAAGAPVAERGPLLLELASSYAELGQVDAELAALARAAREGTSVAPRAARIESLYLSRKSPDGELAYLEVLAALRVDQGEQTKAADAFRDLGAALWDLADDRPRAVQAWLRGAQLDAAYGYATLRADLASFADAQYAVDCLSELVEREKDRVQSGVIATEAARAALEVNAFGRALGLAKTALERDPGRAHALETAETASSALARVPDMSAIYDQVARRARGRFGRRAAHHRAARFFEAGGVVMLALKHAAQAFIAVPSEGSTLILLQRTAKKAQREGVAVRTVEHVAELTRGPGMRAGWLLRAASMTSDDLEGTRQKMDLLLKASILVRTPATLEMLATAARAIVALAPEDDAAVALRLERASEQLAKKLEGPDGARSAITFVQMACDPFKDGDWAWRSLERAVGADADVDEYVSLLPYAPLFAKAEGATDALNRLMAEVEKPYSNVGHALLRLVAAIAAALDDGLKRAKAAVRAAEKESDDDQIVVEADDAIAAYADDELRERLNRRAGNFRRTEALRNVAAALLEKGDVHEAVRRLERASEIAAPEQKPAVAKELGEALTRAGRGEDAIFRELGRHDIDKLERAARWADLAKVRQDRGDAAGAADALLQAATEEPTRARWLAVELAAETAGRDHVRVDALEHLATLARQERSIDELRSTLKKLAQIEGARGSLAAAETAWREVLEADPDDTEADAAIEALLVSRSSFDDLADHLGERAARLSKKTTPEDREKVRAVRLRRAAILEQRLNRLEDACAELEQVLADQPGNPGALRWLADLYERAGDANRALPVLEKLFSSTTEEIEFVSLGVRRVRALLAVGDIAKAQRAVADLHAKTPNVLTVIEARVEVARAAAIPGELGNALVELARISVDEPRVRSEYLVEAAQAAARAGDREGSLVRARDAARLAPDIASTQLFARGLEYRLRGAGTPDEARATIASLARLAEAVDANGTTLEPEDVALRAFLIAEAEDALDGASAGEATLKKCLAQVGAQPLIALGLAERAAKGGRHEEAYRFYIEAVYGNLLGLRRPGRVALAAAESASLAGDVGSTQRFLNEAAKDPDTRTESLRRVAKNALTRGDHVRAKPMIKQLAEALEGDDRAQVLGELARALLDSTSPADRIEGDRTMREAIEVATPALASKLLTDLDAHRNRSSPAQPAVRDVPLPPRTVTPPLGTEAQAAPRAEEPTITVRREEDPSLSIVIPGIPAVPPSPSGMSHLDEQAVMSVRHPPLGSDRPPPPSPETSEEARVATISEIPTTPAGKVAKAKARLVNGGSRDEAEKLLTEALREGSIDAADVLDSLLKDEPAQRATLLKVRRQAVELAPGNLQRLNALKEAARADQNPNYVRAIDHVLRAFDPGAGPLPPAPLAAQNGQPGLLTLLTRHSHEPAGEAFGVTWEGAQAMFAKTPAAAGMTAQVERVVPGGSTALSRLYEVALRLLDPPRFTLFHKRTVGLGKPAQGEVPLSETGMPLATTVALLATPSAVLTGDATDDSSELRWIIGGALSSVLPQNALVFGLGDEASSLWNVLLGAFGPPGLITVDRKDAQLADMLWQTLAPRTQRRLKELLATAEATPFELVHERAKQSGRRVGMFLTGDFGHAARRTLLDFPQADPRELDQPGGLERLCRQIPALADLLRLAVRPEYADARWHLPTQAAQRLASGKLRPV